MRSWRCGACPRATTGAGAVQWRGCSLLSIVAPWTGSGRCTGRVAEDAHHRLALAGSDADHTSTAALDSLEAMQVRAALARLDPPQRQAISLAYYDGLTHVEVAVAVGAPLGTVKYRIRAGLRALSVALAAVRAEGT